MAERIRLLPGMTAGEWLRELARGADEGLLHSIDMHVTFDPRQDDAVASMSAKLTVPGTSPPALHASPPPAHGGERDG